MPLIILGGTFDPPHIGHLVLGECARVQFGADRVVFLPAGDPWRKTGTVASPGSPVPATEARQVTPAAHRVAMTRLAVASNPHFTIDEREVRRAGPSFTVETLQELHAEGHRELVLALGADALADLPNWKEPERIAELATLAVAPKPGSPVPAASAPAHVVVDMPPLAINSTMIRARVAAGLPIRYLVPGDVERYIREHRLYERTQRQGLRTQERHADVQASPEG
ncbi:MAG: nicotinate-nucleotide adenylyltransferase [Dehalococcoidia bacterium]|nr:nicotinate-nucleotide adenylyltransferase [Dehalococcoidia bacterium]